MQKKYIIANWKMNHLQEDLEVFFAALASQVKPTENKELVVCPSFPLLSQAVQEKDRLSLAVKIGAQDCHWEEKGAYTGDVSPLLLKSLKMDYVIVGHSERRQYHNETSEIVSRKAKAAHIHGLMPVVCIGENLEQREKGHLFEVIKEQLKVSLADLIKLKVGADLFIVAYEPIWAIGTGKVATIGEIQEMHQFINQELNSLGFTNSPALLYGGSVKASNAKEILEVKYVDGVLVGGASLKADEFLQIANVISF